MLKVRVILSSLLAAFAVSAVASTTSLAHEFIVEGVAVGAGGEAFQGVQYRFSGSGLEVTLVGSKAFVSCRTGSLSGTLEKEGKSKGTAKLSDCRVYLNNARKLELLPLCAVKAPIELKFKDKLSAGEMAEEEWEGEEAEETFGTVEVKGAGCALNGKYKVKGKETCIWPGSELEKVAHSWACTPGGSKLKIAATEAKLYFVAEVDILPFKKWGVK
jgi:hypothetical protein